MVDVVTHGARVDATNSKGSGISETRPQATNRVTYLDHLGLLSGGELALWTLLSQLDQQRWQPHVVLGQSGPLQDRFQSIDVAVEVMTMPRLMLGEYRGARRML